MSADFLTRFRSFDFLRYEERIALWTLRELLQSKIKQKNKALSYFLGKEGPGLQKYFQSVLLLNNVHSAECELSSVEFYMLKLMARMQNTSIEEGHMSALENALQYLSDVLAAYGYWLPFSDHDVLFLKQKSYMTIEQDNYPSLMQAAE